MSNNVEIRSKKAIFSNGKQLSEYKWDDVRVCASQDVTIVTNENREFALYNHKTGEKLFEINKYFSYNQKLDFIELAILSMGIAQYGAISFAGEIIVPFAFSSVKPTVYSDVFEVGISEKRKGYYLAKTDQVIEAENVFATMETDVNLNMIYEYHFLINNKWKKYSLVDGKYKCKRIF